MAVGADIRSDPRYLGAVIDVAVRGLPHAFRDLPAGPGETVAIDISGPAGGRWTLVRGTERWTLSRGTVRGHRAYSSGRRRGMEAVVQRAVRERCRTSRPRRRTAAARHSTAARSI